MVRRRGRVATLAGTISRRWILWSLWALSHAREELIVPCIHPFSTLSLATAAGKECISWVHFCIYIKLFIVKAVQTGFSVSEN